MKKTKTVLTISALALAGATMTGCGVIGSWVGEGTKVVSAPHVTEQHEKVITHYNGMIAAANNACNAITTAGNDRSATLVEDPAMAYKATYRSIEADYVSTIDNIFKAGLVGPPGYPSSAQIKAIDSSDFCTVGEDLIHLRGAK